MHNCDSGILPKQFLHSRTITLDDGHDDLEFMGPELVVPKCNKAIEMEKNQ